MIESWNLEAPEMEKHICHIFKIIYNMMRDVIIIICL